MLRARLVAPLSAVVGEFLATLAAPMDTAWTGGPNLTLPVPQLGEEEVRRLTRVGVAVNPAADFLFDEPAVRICLAGVSAAVAVHAASIMRAVLQ